MAQVTLQQFREKYPQYGDKSDHELADALHRKFYSAMPREEFDRRIGLILPGNVADTSGAYSDALADASARSQVFTGGPRIYAEPTDDLPVPRPGVSGPSDNIQTTGLLNNIGAGIDRGANALLGAPVDLPVWLGNQGIDLANNVSQVATGNRPIPNIPTDLPGSSQGWERTQEALGFTPPSKVVPANPGEAIARSAAEAATMAAVPEVALMKAGQVLSRATPAVQAGIETLESLFGQSRTAGQFSRSMGVNAAAGAGAEAAMQAAPEGWEPAAGLAGGLSAATLAHGLTELPRAIQQAVSVLGDYLAPLSKAGRDRAAGTILRENATNPGEVIDAIETAPGEFVAGSQPTTFQQTGDMGLGGLERAAATKDPVPFNQRRADQNMARVAALENVQPTGSPEQVVASMRSYMDNIEAMSQATIDAATSASAARVNALGMQADAANANALGNAQGATNALGAGVRPEAAGTALREALEAARAQAKAQERALWQAVDPDGTLTLGSSNTRNGAAQIAREMPASAKPMDGEEAAIFGVARAYGDVVPFSELTALQSRLKTAMRNERFANGESTAYGRMSQLHTALQKDLEQAIVAKVQQEAQSVAAGMMRTEETLEHRWARKRDQWLSARDERAVGQDGGAGIGANGASGPTAVSGAPRTGSQNQGRLGGPPGNPRLPGNAGGTAADAGAVERLNAARAATKERAETFDNKTLAPIRKRPATNAPYDEPAGGMPARIFFPGPKSPEAIRKLRDAVGAENSMSVLRDYAVDRLRKAALRPDGTIDPAKAAAWLRQHDDALQAFPELSASIRRAMQASDQAAATALEQRGIVKAAQSAEDARLSEITKAQRQKVDDAQKGAVGRILGLSDPQDVTRAIGRLFARQDAVKEMQRLREAIGSNEQAREGLRKAVVDYLLDRFVGNTEAATSGLGTIKSDQLQTFVSQNKAALKAAGFTEMELGLFDDIAADLQRANRSIASVKIPGGSNTAQDLMAAKPNDTPMTLLSRMAIASATGGGATLALGPIVGIPAGISVAVLGQLRRNGLDTIDDIVRDALLNPQHARQLMIKAHPQAAATKAVDFGQMFRRATAVTAPLAVRQQEASTPRRPMSAPFPNALGMTGAAALGSRQVNSLTSLNSGIPSFQSRALTPGAGTNAFDALASANVPAWLAGGKPQIGVRIEGAL